MDLFGLRTDRAGGRQSKCKDCMHLLGANWRIRNKDYLKAKWRQFRYKCSQEHFNDLLRTQNNACAICEKCFETNSRPCVDHNHATGKIRGLLCQNCNAAIGMLKEDTEIAKRLITYLEKENV